MQSREDDDTDQRDTYKSYILVEHAVIHNAAHSAMPVGACVQDKDKD